MKNSQLNQRLLGLSRPAKRAVVLGVDIVLALLATWAAYSLREESLHWPQGHQWWVYLSGPLMAVPIFVRMGLYRAIFRYTGLDALVTTALAVGLYAVIHLVFLQWLLWPVFPVTLGVLQPILFLLLIGISRATARFWLAGVGFGRGFEQGRMLIYGAGTVGVQTASALGIAGGLKPYGFIDEDPGKIGQTINGLPVFSPAMLSEVVQKYDITDVLLAIPNVSRGQRNQIIHTLRTLHVHTRTLPALSDLASGKVSVQDVHELDLDDLLGRDAVVLQADLLTSCIESKTVLVTGAGGSIGSELCRQILQQHPRQLLLLEHSEFALYTLHRELDGWCKDTDAKTQLVPLLATVVDRRRLDWICTTYRPHTVYHAAAYKHVPMVECNPSQGLINNVFGTLNMAQAAAAVGASRFVLVSTDKAVRPTNLMGASKRMAELVLQALASEPGNQSTCFSMVRFGNVLGSSGSVVPLFREQLANGGPITVTHPEVTRYFMSIPEAVQLVLQAAVMAQGGEVFVLEMGHSVKILDLAYRLVELSGLQVRNEQQPDGDIDISFIGLRPGEKLYEELLIGDNPMSTAHPRIMKALESFMPWPALQTQLGMLMQAALAEDEAGIRVVLHCCVQGFHDQPDA
ncbi:nucleoside-diphosphate sugar epimerase/dehydratase [Rhodoferax sp.]|uniref:polysaccharide biosynthesis protein n=1 Tax=Rhodoferax sp. TaxID=50421 RepID=UPI002638F667|nr:nucleoside-diphosphate sugar epimerase/dehydratase [Rhodoferax sp.]MDD5479154.1 nucleoside-diphosphate sugar epimerase/dehydratase [Rhodoferax sp.]